jgi:L-ascorbate metabolism protein UlaG (beta-lactamase superfamily)
LSRSTLATFPHGIVVLCPKEAAQYLAGSGLDVRPMAPGDEFAYEGGRIIAVTAHHMGSRYGVHAAADGRALGWVVETPSGTIFYSGDTNYFSGFANVGWTYKPDIALLNVNGHLLSKDAARAAWATGAGTVVPIHWGAFGHWVVGGNRHPREEEQLKRLIGDRLVELNAGQSTPIADPRRLRPQSPP